MYHVRINGQTIGPLDVASLVQRSARWQTQRFSIEVAPVGSQAFVPLDQFLAQLRAAVPPPVHRSPAAPAPPAPVFDKFDVRINGQVLGSLNRADIEQRASHWLKVKNTLVEVAPAGTAAFISLDAFLRSNPVAPPIPSPGGPGMYIVRVNAQVLGSFGRAEIEVRARRWEKLGARVEVAPAGSATFIPLRQFLNDRLGSRERLLELWTTVVRPT